MNNKLILGTAQFGMDYGVNNKRGKILQSEVFDILNKAAERGIDIFDTASSYGESEKIIGEYVKANQKNLKLISKLSECRQDEVRKIFTRSLSMLNAHKLYGYLVHSFENFKTDMKIWSELESLKNEGKIEKIGFSLYLPSELEFIFDNNLKIDIVQFPFSVFDNRFKPYFPELKKKKVEIHARSIFLQGLAFMQPDNLPEYLIKAEDYVRRLQSISAESGIPISALCLYFVLVNPSIDRVIVGVDSLKHLNENLEDIDSFKTIERIYYSKLDKLAISDGNLILPYKWGKN